MSTMIDRWNRIKASAECEAQSHPDELRASRCEGQAHTIKIAIDEFVDACTPRAPRAEWFGTGKGQWDSWWIDWSQSIDNKSKSAVIHDCKLMEADWDDEKHLIIAREDAFLFSLIKSCVPVARDGFPSPVGWKVVE